MPNKPFAFGLFLSSYSPAFLILAVRAIDRSCTLFLIALALAAGSSGAFFLFIRFARKGAPYDAVVADVESRDADLAAYVATYLLPFVLVFGADLQDVIALGLFLFFIGVLWVSSGMLYLNPLLALRGYHVFVVQLGTAGAGPTAPTVRGFLLSRKRTLRVAETVRVDMISPDVFIEPH
ncbi:MAG TPA: hypothetical protein VGN13_09355 [Solirubrobacteraceae bacterium]|jgi:hypothetical protein